MGQGFLPLAVLIVLLSACSTVGYYADAIHGHLGILNQAEPIPDVLANAETPPAVKAALRSLQRARSFASTALLLPDNGSYREYADIGREFAVWNVIATRPYSITPKRWCYPFAGCVSYKGFHDRKDAEALAAELEEQGFDVYVAGARAYSTLGWLDDPLLNTMLYQDEALRIELLFHELAHQKIYIRDDPEFNEAFATFVAQEGVRRWYGQTGNDPAWQKYRLALQRRQEFNALLRDTRTELGRLYRQPLDAASMERRKQKIFAELKSRYERRKPGWQDGNRYDEWMAQGLNNAHLALVATYHDRVPEFQAVLKELNGNLALFYERIEAMANRRAEDRRPRAGVSVNPEGSEVPGAGREREGGLPLLIG